MSLLIRTFNDMFGITAVTSTESSWWYEWASRLLHPVTDLMCHHWLHILICIFVAFVLYRLSKCLIRYAGIFRHKLSKYGLKLQRKDNVKDLKKYNSNKSYDQMDCNQCGAGHFMTSPGFGLQRILNFCVSFAFLVSLPWEFIRLYQEAIAKKAKSVPTQCLSEISPSGWQSLIGWIFSPFSWGDVDCEEYRYTLYTDPFWEVTPVMVVSSLVCRCILLPVERVSRGLGDSLRFLLHRVPWQWQPVIMLLGTGMIILCVAMVLRYRVTLPFLLHLSPSSPPAIADTHTSHRTPKTSHLTVLQQTRKRLKFNT